MAKLNLAVTVKDSLQISQSDCHSTQKWKISERNKSG